MLFKFYTRRARLPQSSAGSRTTWLPGKRTWNTVCWRSLMSCNSDKMWRWWWRVAKVMIICDWVGRYIILQQLAGQMHLLMVTELFVSYLGQACLQLIMNVHNRIPFPSRTGETSLWVDAKRRVKLGRHCTTRGIFPLKLCLESLLGPLNSESIQ